MSNRPLSPHLSIYKPQITSVLSITHRLTGLFLFVGLFYLSWLIIFNNFSSLIFAEAILRFNAYLFSTIIGKAFLFSWALALYYHLCNGIRHLCWDVGYGFSIKAVKLSGLLVIFAALIMTFATWYLALSNL